MNLNSIRNHRPGICGNKECKEFSVLIPIIGDTDKQSLLFEVRSNRLHKQPNEICFPGGKIEEDESPIQAAIRETCEELLISESNIELLGETDTLVTPFNTIIYPFAAFIKDYQGSFSIDEVQEVFSIPLDFLVKNPPSSSCLDVIMKPQKNFPFDKIQYGRDYPWANGIYPEYFYEYQDKIIWGITARILKNFIELINKQ